MKTKLLILLCAIACAPFAHAQTLLKDLGPGTNVGSNPEQFMNVNGTMYFLTRGGNTYVHRVWKSDGTAAGTTVIADSVLQTNIGDAVKLFDVGGTLFFWVNTNGSATTATKTTLWKTDGNTLTFIDTLYSTSPFSGGFPPRNGVAVGNKFFFQMSNGNGGELWVSDGTKAGTMEVTDIFPGTTSGFPNSGVANKTMAAFNGKVYFSGTGSQGNTELWASDGTAAGTALVKEIRTSGASNPEGWAVFNNELYFSANDGGSVTSLWKTDGTNTSKVYAASNQDIHARMRVFNGSLYFAGPVSLFKTDGTTAGTSLVADTANTFAGATSTELFLSYAKALTTPPYITYIYTKTDGTNTSRVSENVGASASFQLVANKMYNSRQDSGTNTSGLWVTDGTDAGTMKLFGGQYMSAPFAYHDTLFFSSFATATGYEPYYYVPGGTTGIVRQNTSSAEVTLYPNPVREVLNIEAESAEAAQIFDLGGRMLMQVQLTNGTAGIATEQLAPGMYVLRLIGPGTAVSKKFVKE